MKKFKEIFKDYLVPNATFNAKGVARGVALVSYLPSILINCKKQQIKHQNRKEALAMIKVLQEFGYDVDIVSSSKKRFIPERKNYDLIFGIEPNFERYSLKYPNAKKIYYATGAYWKYQNNKIKDRTRDLNTRKNSRIIPSRTVAPHHSCEIADYIFQIGSDETIQTYPNGIREKILLIKQSSIKVGTEHIERDVRATKKSFVWFGGEGAVLKGLDFLLEVFIRNKSLELYVCGKLEDDFSNLFHSELFMADNIHYMGWVPMDTEIFKEMIVKCSFVILPSASEGGCPGSVVNLMRHGLIPITSKIACVGEGLFEDLIIKDLDVRNVEEKVLYASNLEDAKIYEYSICAEWYSKKNYNLECYEERIKDLLNKCIFSEKESFLQNT